MGCGWLGKTLFSELSKLHKVECYLRDSTTKNDNFYKSDLFIIAINTKDNYLQTIKNLTSLVPKTSTLILMSSISVYKEFDEEIDENVKITKNSLQKEVEDIVISSIKNSIILRLGGLMGDDRIAGKWSIAREFEDGFVNYVHKDDVVAITQKIVANNLPSGIYNIVAPLHPTRKEIHQQNAKKFNLKLGVFNGFSKRVVIGKKLEKKLNYSYIHKNPLEFWQNS